MGNFVTPAILLRRTSFGDYDLIVTLLTLSCGKRTVIAKNAKKSRKRFVGVLEPFSILHVSCTEPRGGAMAVLQEASLENPCAGIRGDIMKTAYASYWAELLHTWMEEGREQPRIYYLLRDFLQFLESAQTLNEALSIVFHLRFLSFAGLSPNLSHCGECRTALDQIPGSRLFFELAKGGILCEGCSANNMLRVCLSKGTVKQLLWSQCNDWRTAGKLKFNQAALNEGLRFLEKFVVFHLGKEPKSLKFLQDLRFPAFPGTGNP